MCAQVPQVCTLIITPREQVFHIQEPRLFFHIYVNNLKNSNELAIDVDASVRHPYTYELLMFRAADLVAIFCYFTLHG